MVLLPVICRGTDELLGVMDRVHIVNSTLGKALGGAAGTSPSDKIKVLPISCCFSKIHCSFKAALLLHENIWYIVL